MWDLRSIKRDVCLAVCNSSEGTNSKCEYARAIWGGPESADLRGVQELLQVKGLVHVHAEEQGLSSLTATETQSRPDEFNKSQT